MHAVLFKLTITIGGGAYWAGRAAAAHFSALVGKVYSLPAHFLDMNCYFWGMLSTNTYETI
jgi:hypothetical protein